MKPHSIYILLLLLPISTQLLSKTKKQQPKSVLDPQSLQELIQQFDNIHPKQLIDIMDPVPDNLVKYTEDQIYDTYNVTTKSLPIELTQTDLQIQINKQSFVIIGSTGYGQKEYTKVPTDNMKTQFQTLINRNNKFSYFHKNLEPNPIFRLKVYLRYPMRSTCIPVTQKRRLNNNQFIILVQFNKLCFDPQVSQSKSK